MLSNRQAVQDFLTENDTPYWTIKRAEKGDKVFDTPTPENYTLGDSLTKLDRVLDLLEPGRYFIEAFSTPKQTTGKFKEFFNLTGKGQFATDMQTGQYFPQPVISGMPSTFGINGENIQGYIDEKIQKGIEEREVKRENEELKRQIKEMEEEKEDMAYKMKKFQSEIFKHAGPYIGEIIGRILPRQPMPAVAGHSMPGQTTIKQVDDISERLEQVFDRWMQFEEDPVSLCEKIVDMAEKNPGMYKTAKNFLIQQ